MRVITSMRTACCLSLLVAGSAVPAVAAAQLDSGTGLQASREVASPPPAASDRAGGVRAGPAGNRNRMSQARATRQTAPGSASGGGKTTPP